MSAIPDSTLADCEQRLADLQRQLAECRAQREESSNTKLELINAGPLPDGLVLA